MSRNLSGVGVATWAISWLTFIALLFCMRTRAPPLSLSDWTRVAENGRDPAPIGLPGFSGATHGVCLSGAPFGDAYATQLATDEKPASRAPRNRALVYTLRSAIADTGEGDIVDVGGPSHSMARLFLRVLRDYDLCGRKLWSAPAGRNATDAPRDAYRFRDVANACNTTCAAVEAATIALLYIEGVRFEDAAKPLVTMYSRVRPGGVVFVDQYFVSTRVKAAVDAFRVTAGVVEPMNHIQEATADPDRPYVRAGYWRRR